MRVRGRVSKYLLELIEEQGFVHLSLIDPDPLKVTLSNIRRMASALDRAGTSCFLLGGSTASDREFLDAVIDEIKSASDRPVILFPGSVLGVTRKADALFFLSPLNSTNCYYLVRAQALVAPTIKQWGVEAISLAYLIFEPGGTAAYMCQAQPIPRNKPDIAVCFATAAELFGFDAVYLEAGSGAPEPLPATVIRAVRRSVDIPIIVGGGIRTPGQAADCIQAGADMIVQGTRLEELAGSEERLVRLISRIIEAMREAARVRMACASARS